MERRTWLVLGGGAVAVGVGALGLGGLLLSRLPGKIEQLARAQVESTVDADVRWGAVNTSLSALPQLGLTVNDLVVTGRGPFAGVELVRIDQVTLAVDAWSALTSSTARVRGLDLRGAAVTLLVDREGRANWDIVKDDGSPASDEPGLALVLDHLGLTDFDLDYTDRQGRMAVGVHDLELDGSAAWSGVVAGIRGHATIGDLDLRMGRTRYLVDTRWVSDADLAYDTATGGLTFTRTSTTINDFPVALDGSLVPAGEGWSADVRFSSPASELGPLLSLVPRAYAGSMQGVKASGTTSFVGSAKGKYEGDTWPTFDVALVVKDGAFSYPGLPSEVKDLALETRVTHEEGPSASVALDLDQFRLSTGGAPFEASGSVKRMFGDPLVDLTANGRLDLGALSTALPVPEGTEVPAGVLDVDFAVAGARSDFEAPNPERVKARGHLRGRGVRLVTDASPLPITIQDLDLALTPSTATLSTLKTTFGESDLSVTGGLDNLVGYALGGDVLTGALALTSRKLDLRPFQGRDTEEGTTDDEGLLVAVPTDLDLTVTTDLRKVTTRKVQLEDVSGTLTVARGVARMQDLQASMLGGRAVISGRYAAPTAEQADVDLSVDAVSFDVGETVSSFVTLERIAPVLKQLSGQFDTGFALRTKLAKDGTPELSITRSAGHVAPTGKARVQSLDGAEKKLGPLGGAKDGGKSGFGSIELGGDALQYLLQEGTLNLSPFEVKLGGMPATLRGTSSVADRTLDFTFTAKVPLGALGELAGGVKGAKGDQDVVVRLKGPWGDPKVTVKLAGDDPIDAAKGAASAALQAQADQLLDEARRAADALVAEADARAKRLIQQAGDPASKLAAEVAAKELRKKARSAADALLDEARRKADALLEGGGGKKGGGGEAGGDKKGGGKKGKGGKRR